MSRRRDLRGRHPALAGPGDGTRSGGRWGVVVAAVLLAVSLTGARSSAGGTASNDPRRPNDPKFPEQWALENTGQWVNWTQGTPGADINVTRAWDLTTGSRSSVIGLLDDGFDYTAEDLAPNAWVNPGGVNGCPPGSHGYDVPSGKCEPNRTSGLAPHGTAMGYIMGAIGNNGDGLSGVNWATSIMGLSLNSERTASSVVRAIDWAIRAKQAGVDVRVINASWGWLGNSQAVANEIARAGDHGILFVTGAGNTKSDNDVKPVYPCSFGVWNEICVAASDQHDNLWVQSHWGERSVDLAAPGDNICVRPNDETCASEGTSEATAFASGAAALIAAYDPSLSVSQLKARILDNVRPVPALAGKVRTGGVLDVYCAMTNCRGGSNPPPATPTTTTTASSPGGGSGSGGGGSGAPGPGLGGSGLGGSGVEPGGSGALLPGGGDGGSGGSGPLAGRSSGAGRIARGGGKASNVQAGDDGSGSDDLGSGLDEASRGGGDALARYDDEDGGLGGWWVLAGLGASGATLAALGALARRRHAATGLIG